MPGQAQGGGRGIAPTHSKLSARSYSGRFIHGKDMVVIVKQAA
jgi:hypothetical protein